MVQDVEMCAAEVADHLGNLSNWQQPIFPDVTGCSRLDIIPSYFNFTGTLWNCNNQMDEGESKLCGNKIDEDESKHRDTQMDEDKSKRDNQMNEDESKRCDNQMMIRANKLTIGWMKVRVKCRDVGGLVISCCIRVINIRTLTRVLGHACV